MIQISISPIENREVDEAANLCARAFIQTPFTSTVMGGKGEKEVKNLRRGMKMLLKAPGRVLVAKEGEQKQMVGVMRMVLWPDCRKSTPTGLATLPGLIFGGKAFRNVLYFRKKWAEHDPNEPHWHVDPLCVLPEKQGRGIGSQLLTHFCEIVDKDGLLAYLETEQEQNERLYNRFGFKTRESEPIFGEKNVFMWRNGTTG